MNEPLAPTLHRLVPIRIMTTAGWVSGTVHVPVNTRFLDYFKHSHTFLPLSEARVEGMPQPIPFFAVHRSAVQFFMVADETSLEAPTITRATNEHQITCLLPNGRISGAMQVPKDVRLSDWVTHQEASLFVIDHARVDVRDPWTNETVQIGDRRVIVDPRALVGISEIGPPAR